MCGRKGGGDDVCGWVCTWEAGGGNVVGVYDGEVVY